MSKAEDELKIGMWVIYSEGGLWYNIFETGNPASFKTKKEAIDCVAGSHLDLPKPKVKRVYKGMYEYIPRDWDTGRFKYYSSYIIERITVHNKKKFIEMYELDEEDYADYEE